MIMIQKYIKNGESLKVNEKLCTGCGVCVEVCPHNVFRIEERKAHIVNKKSCMECGACKKNCPSLAIEVNSGVGCAAAIIGGLINKSEPTCGCSGDGKKASSSCCG
jgi:NAD-dependent dihydropyrimidine dehydrogenase PreA subunit